MPEHTRQGTTLAGTRVASSTSFARRRWSRLESPVPRTGRDQGCGFACAPCETTVRRAGDDVVRRFLSVGGPLPRHP